MRRITDFSAYADVLPYASEIFGVYQPMLGWRSKQIQQRMEAGFKNDLVKSFDSVAKRFKERFEFTLNADRVADISVLEPAVLDTTPTVAGGTFVFESIQRELPPLDSYDPAIWPHLLDPGRLQEILKTEVAPKCLEWHQTIGRELASNRQSDAERNTKLADQLARESIAAGYLKFLLDSGHDDRLKDLFYQPDKKLMALQSMLKFQDPLAAIDPFNDIDRAGLSPIGIVHLFRQYFYEFDSFLGSPTSHVWLSPGANVELVEISTRRTLIERTTEMALETTVKTEKSTTEQDEISDAVKDDNKSDTKFGVNASATQGWVGGSATATSSIDMSSTMSKAREVTHKHMRQQTEKLSTEIRRNFKSTFKTVTELTDTSSKRYLLNNTTADLINYELRRKMRQVGVQVQDIGTYLCWQTYVDDPGRQLGIAKLVHLAKEPEVGSIPPPEAPPMPQNAESTTEIDIPFVQTSEDKGDLDESYHDGREVDEDFNEGDAETIQADFPGFSAVSPQPGYEFADAIDFDYKGNDVELSARDVVQDPVGRIAFGITSHT